MTMIEKELFEAAKALVLKRYPAGWGGAAALATESGKVLTSVAPETLNDALSLCMEVGACLEAHKLNERVTHSLCVYRESENEEFIILTACGMCQERLSHWGRAVEVAISNPGNDLIFKPLSELMPHHWSQVNGIQLY
jgi:cytidine deaminase